MQAASKILTKISTLRFHRQNTIRKGFHRLCRWTYDSTNFFHFKSGNLKPMRISSMYTEEKIQNSQATTMIIPNLDT